MQIGLEYKKISIWGTVPLYATTHSAGADLFAYLSKPIVLGPLERVLVSTNTYIEIPEGYEGQVRPRSGLSIKYGISIVNSPGTIDSDYRGEIKVPLINLSKESYTISPNDKIAQLVISPCIRAMFVETQLEELSKTERGDKGFGSSGV